VALSATSPKEPLALMVGGFGIALAGIGRRKNDIRIPVCIGGFASHVI
jgi:hypothetical protein